MRNAIKSFIFVMVLNFAGIFYANATDIVWDFTNCTAQSFQNAHSYSFTATDGVT